MRNRIWRYSGALFTVLAITFALGSTYAEEPAPYPNRPIRVIVPFAPGGASDFVGRILQPALTAELGQQIIIENRGGASGNIGVEDAASAEPDGYTLLLGNVGTMAINPGLYPSFAVRPLRDLIPVSEVVDVPSVLVANPSFPPKTVQEFINYAKDHPGQINFGSPGPGSANRLEMESFMRATGMNMVHIPYKGGAGPALVGLMSNETQVMFVTLSSALNFVRQGTLKALAVTSPQRLAVLPDVPTMAEVGFPEMNNGSWQGIFVLKGTPHAIVERLFAATQKVMQLPDVRKRLAAGGVSVVVSKSPAAFATFVKSETERFGTAIKVAHIAAD